MYQEFFERFEIPKVEYREPSREVDDNGDVCSWYVEYDYPSLHDDEVLINLICLVGKVVGTDRKDIIEYLLKELNSKLDTLEECGKESAEQFKQEVKDCFDTDLIMWR